MIEIEKPQIECIETPADITYGKYVVEPLERGYGTTLGNALRRILLSSLPGTAPTTIKIDGVQHEFSTIPGVKEDVTEIVLNVKSLITRLHNTDGIKTVYIEAVGPCEVKAGDIKGDSEVEVLNPDLHIATLDAGATLNMELTLSHGRGYVSADRNKTAQTAIGVIPVDSIYTPVYKVNYTVENTRVGNMTDFDKLTLEVWTDGTISPRDAVSLGAKILCDHFSLFTDLSDAMGSKSTVVEKAEAQRDKVLELTIEELDLYAYGAGTGWGVRKLNLKQSFADPQILIYDAEEHNGTKLSSGMKFCVAQNFSVGDADYNQNNAYCFTCPLTAEGKRQNLTLTLGKVGELHGGADGETRNSYYTIPASDLLIFDLRHGTILARNK